MFGAGTHFTTEISSRCDGERRSRSQRRPQPDPLGSTLTGYRRLALLTTAAAVTFTIPLNPFFLPGIQGCLTHACHTLTREAGSRTETRHSNRSPYGPKGGAAVGFQRKNTSLILFHSNQCGAHHLRWGQSRSPQLPSAVRRDPLGAGWAVGAGARQSLGGGGLAGPSRAASAGEEVNRARAGPRRWRGY